MSKLSNNAEARNLIEQALSCIHWRWWGSPIDEIKVITRYLEDALRLLEKESKDE